MSKLNYRVLEYVKINHHFMTMAEMAEELNIAQCNIKNYCIALGVEAITLRQRASEFILSHKNWTQEALAEKLGVVTQRIRQYANELGIEIQSQREREKNIPINKEEKFIKLKDLSEEAKDEIYKTTGVSVRINTPIKRVADVYTQTGSDITDTLRGITTTQRVSVNANDAFFK